MSHSYPSDISREQFALVLPILLTARRRTKPRTVDLYDVFRGVLYVLKSCCQWRHAAPPTFPSGKPVTNTSGNGVSVPTQRSLPF